MRSYSLYEHSTENNLSKCLYKFNYIKKNYGHLLFLIFLTNKLNAAESQYALSSLSLKDF